MKLHFGSRTFVNRILYFKWMIRNEKLFYLKIKWKKDKIA